MATELEYYATPDPRTDLGKYSHLVADLPSDAIRLGEIVRGLVLHDSVVALQGLKFPPERMADMKRASATSVIDAVLQLDPSSLEVERPVERRMVGFCFHFALLHCAFLRAKRIPARTRCGFAAYFHAERWIDHWVVEYWDGKRWRLHDSQLGLDALSIDAFQDGVVAWDRCRRGVADPSHYGNEVFWGWDELRGSLVNDIGALNKVEVGGWNWCNLIAVDPPDHPHADVDTRLDQFAVLGSTADSLVELRHAFQNDRTVQPPSDVASD